MYIQTGGELRVDHVTISGQSGFGFFAGRYGGAGDFRRRLEAVSVIGGDHDGISLTGCRNCLIESCSVTGVGGMGIAVTDGPGAQVLRNQVVKAGQQGILIRTSNSARLEGNTVSTGTNGIQVAQSRGLEIARNNLFQNGYGINGDANSNGLHIFGHAVRTSTYEGIFVNGADCAIDWNQAIGNSYGIRKTGLRVIYSYNRTQGNAAGGISPAADSINGGGNYP